MNLRFERLSKAARDHFSLLPNLNRTGVELPTQSVSFDMSQPAVLDKDLPVRKLADRQIYGLFIDPDPAELSANPSLILNIIANPSLYSILDQSERPLEQKDGKVSIDLKAALKDSTKLGGVKVYLEARSFPGSPTVDESLSQIVQFELVNGDGVGLQTLALVDGAEIRPADLVLAGDQAQPQQLFICSLDENGPSVIEVQEAARLAGVPSVVIPKNLGMGDTWLQDQFQVGYALGAREQMQVVVHLPRMVNDAALFPTTPNLKNFVEHYFASQSIGLFNDFWDDAVTVSDGGSQDSKLSVAQSYLLYKDFLFIVKVLRYVFGLIVEIDPKQKRAVEEFSFRNLYNVRLNIPSAYRQLNAYTNVDEKKRQAITDLGRLIDRLSSPPYGNISALAVKNEGVELTVTIDGKPVSFLYKNENSQLLNDLFQTLINLHSSGNYGGNLEVSPPMGDQPYGKIFTGTILSEKMNAFLAACAQPLAHAYTSWLKVGHIDELACFVQDSTSPQGFSVCRASPRLAVTLLERLQEAQSKGILVTRLLRGKKWLHEGASDERYAKPPPVFYLSLIKNKDGRYDLSGFTRPIPADSTTTYFDSVYHDDRRFLVIGSAREIVANYAAFITCADLLNQVKVTNRAADDFFLTGKLNFADDVYYAHYANSDYYKKEVTPGILEKVLGKEFPGCPIHPLPVLFDQVESFGLNETSAITPDLVNLQTLKDHVLVPRPYGPRMRPADAVTFLQQFLQQGDDRALASYAQNTLSERWLHSQGLDLTYHWTKAGEKVAVANPGTRPSPLDPDFKEMWRAIYTSIYASTTIMDVPSYYELLHRNDPYLNHPILVDEDLAMIASYFKDGFDDFKNYPVDYCQGDDEKSHPRQDSYEKAIENVKDSIKKANRNVFDDEGNVVVKDWTRVLIPENTVDIFQLYAHLLLSMLGLKVHWVDSWYYHLHDGGIHCGTNVLRDCPP
jgi:hypothetical protein